MANVSQLVVLETTGKEARVQLLTGLEEWMLLASLPRGVQAGNLVHFTEHDEDVQVGYGLPGLSCQDQAF